MKENFKSGLSTLTQPIDRKKVIFENSEVTGLIFIKIRLIHSAIITITFSTILCSFSIFDLSHALNEDLINDEIIVKRNDHKNIMLVYSSVAAISLSILEIFNKYYDI